MKIGMISLGCPKNLVDGEVMLGLAREAGHELTADAEQADVVIVNTCAFIDRAKQESIDAILEAAALKDRGACRRLVVTGCLAERYRDDIHEQIPEVDAVLGTGEVPAIVGALQGESDLAVAGSVPAAVGASPGAGAVRPAVFHRRRPRHEPLGGRASLPTYLYDASTPRARATPRHYAYAKVAEGCDYTCAFCIIPRLRGPYRSRPAGEIVREAEQLAAQGVRELVLISQDTTFYGNDRGERGALAGLLRQLDRVDGLTWVRLLYLYPTTIDDAMLDAMAEGEKICKYVDLPLQHASDAVLKRMRRPGTRAGYERLLGRIRQRVPGVTLRTTFIAGFPGETREEFAELEQFVDAVGFDHVGVFTYSHEAGTTAGELDDDVPPAEKRRRQAALMARQKTLVRRVQEGRIGQAVQVMVDGPDPEHPLVMRGRLAGQAPEIDPVVYFTECDPATLRSGAVVATEVVAARDYDLVVRPLP